MWYEVRVLGADDFFGDASENGGWALYVRTNVREEAFLLLAKAVAEYGEDLVDLEVY